METWKAIAGYEGRYEVSDLGRVRSLERTICRSVGKPYLLKGRVLKPLVDSDGYHMVMPAKEGVYETLKIHRLVAIAFLPAGGAEQTEVNHKNLVKSDNRVGNLEWATHAENVAHAVRNGAHGGPAGRRLIGVHVETGEQIAFPSSISAQRAGFHRGGIYMCLNGRWNHHAGYRWSAA